eukprot:1008318_1
MHHPLAPPIITTHLPHSVSLEPQTTILHHLVPTTIIIIITLRLPDLRLVPIIIHPRMPIRITITIPFHGTPRAITIPRQTKTIPPTKPHQIPFHQTIIPHQIHLDQPIQTTIHSPPHSVPIQTKKDDKKESASNTSLSWGSNANNKQNDDKKESTKTSLFGNTNTTASNMFSGTSSNTNNNTTATNMFGGGSSNPGNNWSFNATTKDDNNNAKTSIPSTPIQNNAPGSTAAKDNTAAASSFSWGQSSTTDNDKPNATAAKTSFGTGNIAATTSFSGGSTNAAASTSFGSSSSNTKQTATTTFNFGGGSGGTGAGGNSFSWGAQSTANKDDEKKETEAKKKDTATVATTASSVQPPASTVSIGSSAAGPNAFSFGASSGGGTNANNNSKAQASASSFGFGVSSDGSNKKDAKKQKPNTSEQKQQSNESQNNNQQQTDSLRLNDYSVDQILRLWEGELEDHVNSYIQHGAQIRHWDKKLFDNSSSIIELQKEVASLVDTQCGFNIELEKIRGQQQNLNSIIEELEKTLGTTPNHTNTIQCDQDNNMVSMLHTSHNVLNNTNDINLNRNDVYSMAETIDSNLTSLNERLQIKINQLNQSNQAFVGSKQHPLSPVLEILNNHMASLNWIDDKTQQISHKITQIQSNMPQFPQ